MKKKAFWVATFSVLIFAFCTTSISFAGEGLWPKKEKELCWNAGSGLLRLIVMQTVKNNYLVHGSHTADSGSLSLVNGNAIVYSDSIVFHISSASYHETGISGFLGIATLELDTLDGEYQAVGLDWNEGAPPNPPKPVDNGLVLLEYTTCP